MSAQGGFSVANQYRVLLAKACELGSKLHDPFMMLSFLALPVIPLLKMTDLGLFSTETFSHVPVFVDPES